MNSYSYGDSRLSATDASAAGVSGIHSIYQIVEEIIPLMEQEFSETLDYPVGVYQLH
jgi:hypothetical protein